MRKSLFGWIFILFLGLHAALLLSQRLFPFVDLPNHLAEAAIVRHYHGDNLFAQFYHVRPLFGPNALHLLFISSPLFPSVEAANRIYLALYAVLLPLTVLLIIRKLGGNRWFALLTFPVLYHHSVHFGFMSYTGAVAVVLLLFYVSLYHFERPRWWTRPAILVLLLGSFIGHGLTAWFAPGLFLFMAMARRGWSRALLADAALALPLLALNVAWWNLSYAPLEGQPSLGQFLADYYTRVYVPTLADRRGLFYDATAQVFPSPWGSLVSALISTLILFLCLFFGARSWRALRPSVHPGAAAVWVLAVFALFCSLVLPPKIPDGVYVHQRFPIFFFLAVILLGSLRNPPGIPPWKTYIMVGLAAAHLLLWRDHLAAFDRDAQEFTPELFAGVPRDEPLAAMITDNRFEAWRAYRHFPNYFTVWRRGVATSMIVEYSFGFVTRKVGRDRFPAYLDWTPGNDVYDGRYEGMNYLLLRGPEPEEFAPYRDGYRTFRRAGEWTILEAVRSGGECAPVDSPAGAR
ncbi:MAG: hypothetical protein C4524_01355 [Candidatus Zixiibacteriota bacterium]|nr:MAG: hypothetical protein C4524_01355 [candidate division Zixibacteria bacterium]